MTKTNPTIGLPMGWLDLKHSLRMALLGGVFAALWAISWPNIYTAEAKVLPSEGKGLGAVGQMAGAAAAFGISVGGAEGVEGNFIDIINSRWLRGQLIATRYRYHAKTWLFGRTKEITGTLQEYLRVANEDQAARDLGAVISASRDLKTKLLVIRVETISPNLSQQVAADILRLLNEFVIDKAQYRGGVKATFTSKRLAEARDNYDQAELALKKFVTVNRNFQVSGDPTVRLEGARLEGELTLRKQLLHSIALSYEQALLEEKNDIPILNVLDVPVVPKEKSKPTRAVFVMGAFGLSFVGSWLFRHRRWVGQKLMQGEPSELSHSVPVA